MDSADRKWRLQTPWARGDRPVRAHGYSVLPACSERCRYPAEATSEPATWRAGDRRSPRRGRGGRFIARTYRLVIRSILSAVLLVAWTRSGAAQTNSQPNQSADEQAKQVANPLPPLWLLQFQQNNNWLGMPSPVRGARVQSNLLFQPLLPLKLSNDWRVVFRPVLTLFNSVPSLNLTGKTQRTTGFGDTIFAAAISPRTTLVGSWLLALGPTFIFPTGGTGLGQKKWQFGPFSIVGYRGEHFLAYVFPQQWFSIGGNGKNPTSQMSMSYSFDYFFKSGWTVTTAWTNRRAPK